MKVNDNIPAAAKKTNPPFAEIKEQFVNPPQRYAPFEFWFWDQKLDTLGDKPVKMAKELAKKGFNPGYAHARANYASEMLRKTVDNGVYPIQRTEWLSDRWFEEITKVLKQAKEDGTVFSITDDFGWPSLQAGGFLLEKYPDMYSRTLFYDTVDVRQGQSAKLPECDFAVCGKVIAYRDANYVEYNGTDWNRQRSSFEMSPPTLKAGLPYNMGSYFTANSANSAVFHPCFVSSGKYTFSARWSSCGNNSEKVIYTIAAGNNTKVIEVNQRENTLRWNELAEIDIDISSPVTVTVSLGSEGIMCVDAIRFSPLDCSTDDIIIDDLHTLKRKIATFVPETLRYVEGDSFTASDGDYRIFCYSIKQQRGYDGSRVNNLDLSLGKKFTDIAYQPYFEKCKDYMGYGNPLEGFFADTEGGFGYKLAWSEDLEKKFAEYTSKDLRLCLPFMCDEAADGSEYKIRYAWYDAVSDIFTENFSAPAKLCVENGLYYTMHTWEESLPFQVNQVGNYFKLNRAIPLPGTDCLINTAYNPANFWDTLSISDFEGKRYMAEMMALAWLNEYNYTELLKQVNYLAAWGVGHIVTHSLKMTRIKAQEVVTPDFFDIDPAWKDMKCWTDYVKRISYINSLGKIDASTLLFNPMESVWCLTEGSNMDKDFDMIDVGGGIPANTASHGGISSEINRIYHETIRCLANSRVAFLTADRYYLDKAEYSEGKLLLNERKFTSVILPSMKVISRSCAEKLYNFALGGGKLIIIGAKPDSSPEYGRADSFICEIFDKITALDNVYCVADIEDILNNITPCVSFCNENERFDMLALPRIADGKYICWLANNNPTYHLAKLKFGAKGNMSVMDPMTGNTAKHSCTSDGDGTVADMVFYPWQGYYVIIDPSDNSFESADNTFASEISINEGWRAKISECDNAGCRVISEVELTEKLKKGESVNLTDWREWGFVPDRFSGTIDYTWSGELPEGANILALDEVGQSAEVIVNGENCGTRISQPYHFDISSAVKKGANDIVIRVSNSIAANAGIPEPLCGIKGNINVKVKC